MKQKDPYHVFENRIINAETLRELEKIKKEIKKSTLSNSDKIDLGLTLESQERKLG